MKDTCTIFVLEIFCNCFFLLLYLDDHKVAVLPDSKSRRKTLGPLQFHFCNKALPNHVKKKRSICWGLNNLKNYVLYQLLKQNKNPPRETSDFPCLLCLNACVTIILFTRYWHAKKVWPVKVLVTQKLQVKVISWLLFFIRPWREIHIAANVLKVRFHMWLYVKH